MQTEDDSPRINWKLAKIIEQKNDRMIRSVKLRSQNGIINQPISKLYPLEVQLDKVKQQMTRIDRYAENEGE